MNLQTKLLTTADEFLRWNEGREGKREFVRERDDAGGWQCPENVDGGQPRIALDRLRIELDLPSLYSAIVAH